MRGIFQPLTAMMDIPRQVIRLAAFRLPDQNVKIMCDGVMPRRPMRVQRRPLVHHMAVPPDRMAPRVDRPRGDVASSVRSKCSGHDEDSKRHDGDRAGPRVTIHRLGVSDLTKTDRILETPDTFAQ
jgi:hypothetical protein